MKKVSSFYFTIGLFFISTLINAQSFDTVYVQLDSLKENSVRLDSVWRYHSGDDSTWASPDYDASDWDTLKTWFLIDEIPENKWTGIGWFRKTIVVDSALINKSLALQMFHYGASQIFWNGNLIHEFGEVGIDTSSERMDQPNNIPIVINLDSTSVNTLAIRYSNVRSIIEKDWTKRWFRGIGFRVTIREMNNSFNDLILGGRASAGVNFGIAGLFLALSTLYFFLFIFYARRIENLYYSLFTLFIGFLFVSMYFSQAFFINFTTYIVFSAITALSLIYVFLFYLAFLNAIFYNKMIKIFWMFLFFTAIYSIIYFLYIPREILQYSIPGFIALATLEGLRIIIVAIKQKKQNAWVIGGGVITFATLILSLFSIALFTDTVNISGLFAVAVFMIGLFSIPLSMAVYLAKQIALTNKNLEKQLEAVKELSAKELEHQKRTAQLELEAERERVENERKTKELEEARNLQLSLLPKEIPELPDYEIAVYMKTATEVGGDYYDFNLNDDILTVAIGDATGHGLNAGTMVTATKSLFNNFAENPDILESMEKMSLSLKKMNFRFLSMCLALLKFEKDAVKISSAGMPPVYIYRKEEGKVEEVLLKGMPLGTVKGFPYKLIETDLTSGDVLFLYSDGFPELFNSKKELLGYEKIKEEFKKVAIDTPQNIIDNLRKVIDSWKGNIEVNDDITFVVIKKR